MRRGRVHSGVLIYLPPYGRRCHGTLSQPSASKQTAARRTPPAAAGWRLPSSAPASPRPSSSSSSSAGSPPIAEGPPGPPSLPAAAAVRLVAAGGGGRTKPPPPRRLSSAASVAMSEAAVRSIWSSEQRADRYSFVVKRSGPYAPLHYDPPEAAPRARSPRSFRPAKGPCAWLKRLRSFGNSRG